MNERTPRIWVLLGERRGDNNQMLGLAEALGTPFETRTMAYRSRWLLLLRLFPTKPFLLTGKSRRTLRPPWPDLVIGIGRRSVAVARWIKDQSGGRTRIIRLGNPRADTRLFDLVITTAQYPVPANGNVLVLPIAISRNSKPPKPTEAEAARLAGLSRPHFLVSLG
ncbi:MAG TPA: ELM1/GtrOC1 family putative glycosyltransferase, partial [Sphingomicrobium sp.]